MKSHTNHLTHEKLDAGLYLNAANHDKTGAVVLFSGNVRNHHEGKGVDYLEYEAQEELAETTMASILEEASSRWQLQHVFAIHRLGRVGIAEASVVVVTAASHRDAAYEANRFIIDEIKSKVPIWKKEFFSDGNSVWQ